MKFKVVFYNAVNGLSTNDFPMFMYEDINHYCKMFDSGIRINKYDNISFYTLEDYCDGFYGDAKMEYANKWSDGLFFPDVICSCVDFIPRIIDDKISYTEVRVHLDNQ